MLILKFEALEHNLVQLEQTNSYFRYRQVAMELSLSE